MSLIHPEWIGDRFIYCESGTTPGDLADKLRFGDRARGWEGDERLALSYVPDLDRWEIWRREHDEVYRLVCASPPGVPLDERIIDQLVSRDRQRGFDVERHVVENNERVQAERQAVIDEEFREEQLPRLRHGIRKLDP